MRGGGTCLWPLQSKQRATVKALGIVQRNLGRRVTFGELAYLEHSEVWHEFLYRIVRGQSIALQWEYVNEGPLTPEELESFIADGLAQLVVGKERRDDEPEPARAPTTAQADRVAKAKEARRRHRGSEFGL
ncbi:hypothetical protein LCGC14_1343490 [marine sediment metagenome]|uniref:Uncharacterized protein n=1 Tax=marine sediment metagenome TaxID=412755 RepID=A0A0F9KZC4_9ZZZZ